MGHLTEEQKQFYEDNGYIIMKNLLSEVELSVLIQGYEKIFKRQNGEITENSSNGGKSNDHLKMKLIRNLQNHHAVFTKLITNDKILDALEDIMETENIMLHQIMAVHEPPTDGITYPMHQDYHNCPYKNNSMVSLLMHLDAGNADNGGLLVYPGSHKLGLQEVEGTKHHVNQKKFPLEKGTLVATERGDMIIFSYFLIHGAMQNKTNQPRCVIVAEFAAANDKPRDRQRAGAGIMIRGAISDML